MSLLLCFFIMLFAISIIAEPRFQAVADTLTQDFTGHAAQSRITSPSTRATPTITDSAAKNRRIAALTGGQPTPGPQGEAIHVHTIFLDGDTVRGGVIRFELGSDELTPQAQLDLRTILHILQGSPQKIMVRGYSAPVEEGGMYERSSDLAFFRALRVVDYFIELGLEQEFFEVAIEPGAAPQRILLPSGTPLEHAGASVEIILLNQTLRNVRE